MSRKREYVGSHDHPNKRGSDLGTSWMSEYHTVLLLKGKEFAKVIGRGGKIVNDLRNRTGAHIKGIDLEGDDRILTIGGSNSQIIECFEVVLSVLYTSYLDFCDAASSPAEPFRLFFIIGDNRAGRIIGNRGKVIADIQKRSGCRLQMSRTPLDLR